MSSDGFMLDLRVRTDEERVVLPTQNSFVVHIKLEDNFSRGLSRVRGLSYVIGIGEVEKEEVDNLGIQITPVIPMMASIAHYCTTKEAFLVPSCILFNLNKYLGAGVSTNLANNLVTERGYYYVTDYILLRDRPKFTLRANSWTD